MNRKLAAMSLGAVLAFGTVYLAVASSHREAPLISADPLADNTDVYAFVSPDAPDTVTLIANWIPLEAPGGGPNFYKFGDDVLYRINIDNDGDAHADVAFSFVFSEPKNGVQTGTVYYATRSQAGQPERIPVTGGFAEVSDRGLTVLAESAGAA